MSDARISTKLPSHPKTKKLVKRLGQAGGWNLVCLFLWVAANRPSGDLSGLSVEDIELAADWDGEEGDFVAALVAVRFLDGEDGSYAVHDWAEHNPWAAGFEMRSAKARWNAVKGHHGEAEADRQVPEYAAVRKTVSSASSDATSSATSTTDSSAQSTAPSLSPSLSPSEDLFTSAAADAPPPDNVVRMPKATPDCPHQQIIDLYHEILPMGTQVRVWSDSRKSHLQARWRQSREYQSVDWWRRFFEYIGRSNFLTSKVPPSPGRKQFVIALDWIVNAENFARIIEGRYENNDEAQHE